MLKREQLAKLGAMIEARYEALSAEIRADAARSHDETYGELAGPVADSGDKATADLISDLNNAELDRDLVELRQLDVARKRLADNSYGTCVDCGSEIDFKRLLAQPAALRCLECQQAHEKNYAHAPEPKL